MWWLASLYVQVLKVQLREINSSSWDKCNLLEGSDSPPNRKKLKLRTQFCLRQESEWFWVSRQKKPFPVFVRFIPVLNVPESDWPLLRAQQYSAMEGEWFTKEKLKGCYQQAAINSPLHRPHCQVSSLYSRPATLCCFFLPQWEPQTEIHSTVTFPRELTKWPCARKSGMTTATYV